MKKQIIDMTYAEYMEHFYTLDTDNAPLTAPEFESHKANLIAVKAAAKNIMTYQRYIEQASALDDKWECEAIIREMRAEHDAECVTLYKAGRRDEIGPIIEAFDAAVKTIRAPYKKARRDIVDIIGNGDVVAARYEN